MNQKTKLEELEEMINAFPPDFGLAKKALVDKVSEVKYEIQSQYYPNWQSVIWSVEDFAHKAKELQQKRPERNYKFDESKYEHALSEMIRKHDANLGITWDTVEIYLLEHCISSFELDDYESKLH